MNEKLPLLAHHDALPKRRHARWQRTVLWSILAFLAVQSLLKTHKHGKHKHRSGSSLRWKTCPDDKAFQCGYLDVPLNVRKLAFA